MLQCGDCKRASFCSEACVREATPVHALECPVLSRLGEVREHGPAHGTTFEHMRLVLRTLVLCCLEQQEQGQAAKQPPLRFDDVMELRARTDGIERMERTEMMLQAHALAQITDNEEIALDEADGVEVFFRLRHHTVSVQDRSAEAAHTLSPLVSMMRHSCLPNAVVSFDDDGTGGGGRGRAHARAVRDIAAGERVTRAQVPLYQVELVRRYQLRSMRGLEVCGCERCEASLEESPDRYIGGFACVKCEGAPPAEMRLWDLPGGRTDFSGWVHCDRDGCEHKAQVGYFLDAEKACEEAVSDAVAMAHEGDEENARAALKALEERVFSSENARMLGPGHSVLVDGRLLAASLCARLDERAARVAHARAAVESQRSVFGGAEYPELAFAWHGLGAAVAALLNAARAEDESKDGDEEAEALAAEAQKAFREAARIRNVCFGPDHAATKDSAAQLAAVGGDGGGKRPRRRRRRGGRGRRGRRGSGRDEKDAQEEEGEEEEESNDGVKESGDEEKGAGSV